MIRPSLGFVGLGSLGLAVARNLLDRGRAVVGHRRSDPTSFVEAGGRAVASPRAVFEAAEVVFTCLPDASSLASVVEGEEGFLTAAATGRTVVDLSTTDLASRLRLRARLRQAGSTLVDCPVSGLPAMVVQRSAVLLTSGDRHEFEAVEGVLRDISDEVRFAGAFGSGTVLKYLANFLMVIHAAAAAEAVGMAERCGLDPALAVDILKRSAGGSAQLAIRGPRMAAGDFDAPQATLDGLVKDLGLIGDLARSVGLDSALLGAAADRVDQTRRLGLGSRDPTALVEAVRRDVARTPQPKLIQDGPP